jgi:hypothetical protein
MADLESWQNLLETQSRESQEPAFTPTPDGDLACSAELVSIVSDPVLKPASEISCIFGQISHRTHFIRPTPSQAIKPPQESTRTLEGKTIKQNHPHLC